LIVMSIQLFRVDKKLIYNMLAYVKRPLNIKAKYLNQSLF